MGKDILGYVATGAGLVMTFIPGLQGPGIALALVGGALLGASAKEQAIEAMREAQNQNVGLQADTRTSQRMVPVVYGRQKIGGNLLYFKTYTHPAVQATPNGSITMIWGMGEGELAAIEEMWFDDVCVWRNGAYLDTPFRLSFLFDYRLGTADQTYFTRPHELDPDYEDCYIHTAVAWVDLAYDSRVFQALPEITWVVRGLKCYDPRNATTAWTRTGPVQFRDLLTSVRYGAGVAAAVVDDVAIAEEANFAEEVIVRDDNLVVTDEQKAFGNRQAWINELHRVVGSPYSGTLAHIPVSPGSLQISFREEEPYPYELYTDNGDGTLTGNLGGSGTINYATGEFTLTFSGGRDEHAACSYWSGQRMFSFRLGFPIIDPGSVIITDGVETFADNGAGTLAGSAGGTGTVDYQDGGVSVTFAVAPSAASAVRASYESSSGPRYVSDYFAIDGRPALDALREFLDHFQAVLLYSGGIYRLRIEKPDVVAMHFRSGGVEDSGNNILDGSFSWKKAGIAGIPSGIRGKWTNPMTGYKIEDYVIPISAAGTQNELSFNLPGITDLAVLERLLFTRRNLALLEISSEFASNLSAIPLEPLDVIDVVHPDASWNTAKKFRISALMDSVKDETTGLTLVEYDPAAYVDQPNVLEVKPPPMVPPPNTVPPSVTDLTLDEFWRQLADATWTSWIRVTFTAPADYPYVDAYEVYARNASEGGDYKIVGETRSTTFEFGPVKERQTLTVLVVVRSLTGVRYMETGVIASIVPGGKDAPPSDVTFADARCTFVNKVILEWNPIPDTDLAYYEVRTDLNWGNAAGMVYKGKGTSFWMEPAQENYTFHIKAVDTTGNFSTNHDSITLTHETPVPVFVSAAGGFQRVRIEWEPIADEAYGAVEVWRSVTNDRATAVKVGEVHSNVFVDTKDLAPNTTYYYWLRTRSVSGYYSAWDTGDTAGHSATTATINTADLADGIISKMKLAPYLNIPEVVTVLPSLPDPQHPVGKFVYLLPDGKLYRNRWKSGAAPESPTITTTSLAGGSVDAPYSATLAATGGTAPYAWSIISGSLPSGLQLAQSTGVISGTPTTEQTANFTVRVTDANSLTDDQALSITIATSGVVTDNFNRADEATLAGNWETQTGRTGVALVSNAIRGSSGTVSCVSRYKGAAFNQNQYAQVKIAVHDAANWTIGPTVRNQAGADTFYRVQNEGLSQVRILRVKAGVETQSSPVAYTPSVGDVLKLEAVGDAASTSLKLYVNGNLILTWVDNASPITGGTPGVVVQGTTSAGDDWQAGGVGVPSITTTSLPGGTVGVAYNQTLTATGGTTPYAWSIVSGALPSGLQLAQSTGVISGTPTTEQTANFTVRVTDAVSQIDDQAFSIAIAAGGYSVTDDFNRANQNPIAGNWATQTGCTGIQLLNNEIRGSSGTISCISRYTAGTFDTNQYSQLKVAVLDATNYTVGPCVRMQSAANTLYRVAYEGTAEIRIRKTVAGSNSDSPTASYTPVVGDVIRLEAVGDGTSTTLKIYVNGTPILTWVDNSSPITGGRPGVVVQSTTSAGDDWEGGDA